MHIETEAEPLTNSWECTARIGEEKKVQINCKEHGIVSNYLCGGEGSMCVCVCNVHMCGGQRPS